jgi:hypothetical protein
MRTISELCDLLRPLHAFQAAELILAELSETGGEEVLYPGVIINRRTKLLAHVLHAWAALTQEQADRELHELRHAVGRVLVS